VENDRDGQRRHDAVPTEETYTGFQKAYEFLNQKLFDGELPNCLITPNRFNGRGPLLFTLPQCGIAARCE
jgi:hypothetical protein